ncbi:hypothetical protein [Collimonas arenae]|uniref:hypothetical protein n=1 Tax=Collimonas arenae TaxID=279058 RepID=UPI0012E0ACCF|nr:hypothetical protein [Collimonas arenae]
MALFLSSMAPSTATSFAGLEHQVHFSKNSNQISSEEIRSLVEWEIKTVQFGGVDYGVFAYRDDRLQIDLKLAERRRDAIVLLMNTLGIQIKDTGIENLNAPYIGRKLSQEEASTVFVTVQPPCIRTRSCLPVPISASKPQELNK